MTESIHIHGYGTFTVTFAKDVDREQELERVLRKELDVETVKWIMESRGAIGKANEKRT